MKILTPNLSAFVNTMISALVSVLLTVSLYWVAPSPSTLIRPCLRWKIR